MQNLFSYPIVLDELSASEKRYNLLANSQDLEYLKEVLKVESVKSFSATIMTKFYKKEHRLSVWGSIQAKLELKSVISLENFYKTYTPEFSSTYDTEASLKDIKELEIELDEDEPDIILDGQLDLGQVAIEQLALVMEDHPRKDGEIFCFKTEFCEEDTEALNPFSVLKNIKK